MTFSCPVSRAVRVLSLFCCIHIRHRRRRDSPLHVFIHVDKKQHSMRKRKEEIVKIFEHFEVSSSVVVSRAETVILKKLYYDPDFY